ncbi:unnamed protein product, partial [Symbiodinium sp. CCMP2456]
MRSEADFEDEIEAATSKDANALRSLLAVKCGEPKATEELNWVMNPLNVGDWVSLGKSGASLVGAVVTDVAEALAETTPVGIILTLQSGMNSHLDRNELKRQLQEARAANSPGAEAQALCLLELNMFNRKVLIASTAIGIAGLVGAIASLGTAAPIIVTVGMLLKRFVQKRRTSRETKKCAELQEEASAVSESELRTELGDKCDPNQEEE